MCNSISKAMIAAAIAMVTAMATQSALAAQSGLTFREVRVDVSPLRANALESHCCNGEKGTAERTRSSPGGPDRPNGAQR